MCGKRIRVQHRGLGGSQYRAPRKGIIAPTLYPYFPLSETHVATVKKILHDRARSTPIAQVAFDDGRVTYINAVKNLTVDSVIMIGKEADVRNGNILPIGNIPEGTMICNIEKNFGDGGSLVRTSGTSAILFAQSPSGAIIKLPSGKTTTLKANCRATIGMMAGSGRIGKPFLKAGTKAYAMKAKAKVYPRSRGVAMGSFQHPFGGGRHQGPHKPKTISRNAPPGRKVGLIAASRTGKKKRK